VPAEPGTGIERHETEGLRLGRVDHLPDIDSHGVVDELQFVHERDICGAEDVLGELHCSAVAVVETGTIRSTNCP